jgi:hypothetical protein
MGRIALCLCGVMALAGCRHDHSAAGDTGRDAGAQLKPRTMTTSKRTLLQETIGPRLTVILAEAPNLDGNTLRLQDYVRDGKSFIPVFASAEAFRASTGGANLGRETWEVDRRLFASILGGNETLVFNPGLDSELSFSGQDFRQAFPEPFDPKGKNESAP